jgi:hypothetical protein
MLPETLSHLKQHGFLRGEEQVDRAELAEACMAILTRQTVSTAAEIQEKALIVPELRHQLFGQAQSEDVEAELDAILAPLTGPKGHVQDKLENGFVLCSAQVSRKLSNNGGAEITIKRNGRFVTSVAELIEEHYWKPGYERLIAGMKALNNRFELGIRRQPALASRRQPMVAQTHDQLAIEMPRQS